MDARPPLSPRQAEALDFIERFIADHAYPPTVREVAEGMGIRSTNGANDHIKALARKGYVERVDGQSRALKVVRDDPESHVLVAVLGRLATAEKQCKLWEARARELGWGCV